jgi:hypothetical protein
LGVVKKVTPEDAKVNSLEKKDIKKSALNFPKKELKPKKKIVKSFMDYPELEKDVKLTNMNSPPS